MHIICFRNTISRRTQSRHVGKQDSRVVPVQRCPPEILSEIFLFCLANSFEMEVCSDESAPLLLGQICSHWRKVAVSTPRLWTSMSFGILLRNSASETELAKVWLMRAYKCPLSIKFGDYATSTESNSSSVIDLLVSTCDRWQDLHLSLPSHMADSFSPVRGRLFRLKSLSIRQSWADSLCRWSALGEAPQLRNLCLDDPRNITNILDLPWHQLKTLCLRNFRVNRALEVLQKCPNLAQCEIIFYNSDLKIPPMPIQLTHMCSLHLETQVDPTGLLISLELPALKSLRIVLLGPQHREWAVGSSLAALLTRSRCPLQTLCLDFHAHTLHDIDLIKCLESVPSLLTLELRRRAAVSLTFKVLDRLTNSSSECPQIPCLVPQLQVLTIDHRPFFHDSHFARMLQSRWWWSVHDTQAARLVTVEISSIPHSNSIPSTLDVLRQCQDEGLHVRLNFLEKEGL